MADRLVALYDAPEIEVDAIGAYVDDVVPDVDVEVRDRFVDHHDLDVEEVAKQVARCRVTNLNERTDVTPLPGEVVYERRVLDDPRLADAAVLYDGEKLSAKLRAFLPDDERSLSTCHIVFTPRLVATYQDGDRYHARVVVCAFPSLVSSTGLVEAPAKPRDFYVKRQALQSVGGGQADVHELKEQYGDRFVDHGDPRAGDFLKGYALQAVMWTFGDKPDPFCDDEDCRLFNAHWQEAMIRAQSGGLCDQHRQVFESL